MSQIELDNFVETFFNDVETNLRDYRYTVSFTPSLTFTLGKMA
jgi:hypothetical protein